MNIHLEEVKSKEIAIRQIQSIQKELHEIVLQDVRNIDKYIIYRVVMLKGVEYSSNTFPTSYVKSSPRITF